MLGIICLHLFEIELRLQNQITTSYEAPFESQWSCACIGYKSLVDYLCYTVNVREQNDGKLVSIAIIVRQTWKEKLKKSND